MFIYRKADLLWRAQRHFSLLFFLCVNMSLTALDSHCTMSSLKEDPNSELVDCDVLFAKLNPLLKSMTIVFTVVSVLYGKPEEFLII